MHNFLFLCRRLFTQNGTGKSLPRGKNLWKAANAYFEGMLRPGKRKNMQSIYARKMNSATLIDHGHQTHNQQRTGRCPTKEKTRFILVWHLEAECPHLTWVL